jgi:hypothetical protein
MRHPLSVQVEPLSPQRWTRIERSLFSRVEAEMASGTLPTESFQPWARRAVPWLVAASLALMALAVLWLAAGRPADGRGSLAQASRITTGSTGSHLVLRELTLDVDPESTVVIGGATERGMLLVLDRGSVVCDVTPRSASAPLIVQAGAAQIQVVGTRFRVQRDGEAAKVAVEHGVVEVTMNGQVSRVRAGQVWPAAAPATLPSTHTKEVVAAAPVELSEPSEVRRSTPRPQATTSAPMTNDNASSAQARFERAARLERADPGQATALYRTLESGSDSWAQNALYARGRLEAARGNTAEARKVLERYLARFPKGANRDDAKALLERLR